MFSSSSINLMNSRRIIEERLGGNIFWDVWCRLFFDFRLRLLSLILCRVAVSTLCHSHAIYLCWRVSGSQFCRVAVSMRCRSHNIYRCWRVVFSSLFLLCCALLRRVAFSAPYLLCRALFTCSRYGPVRPGPGRVIVVAFLAHLVPVTLCPIGRVGPAHGPAACAAVVRIRGIVIHRYSVPPAESDSERQAKAMRSLDPKERKLLEEKFSEVQTVWVLNLLCFFFAVAVVLPQNTHLLPYVFTRSIATSLAH